jgi:hypothetical protein
MLPSIWASRAAQLKGALILGVTASFAGRRRQCPLLGGKMPENQRFFVAAALGTRLEMPLPTGLPKGEAGYNHRGEP